jgi:hypothetical protein
MSRRAWVCVLPLKPFGLSGVVSFPCVLENSTCVDEEREPALRRRKGALPTACHVKLAVYWMWVGLGGGYCALRVYFH